MSNLTHSQQVQAITQELKEIVTEMKKVERGSAEYSNLMNQYAVKTKEFNSLFEFSNL